MAALKNVPEKAPVEAVKPEPKLEPKPVPRAPEPVVVIVPLTHSELSPADQAKIREPNG
jgi:hypothetical protein